MNTRLFHVKSDALVEIGRFYVRVSDWVIWCFAYEALVSEAFVFHDIFC